MTNTPSDKSGRSAHRLLGLFPYFMQGVVGGIQASAQIAWELLSEKRDLFESATLFCYADKKTARPESANGRLIVVNSKEEAIYQTLRRKWNQDFVIIWHLGLIKLLPSFRLNRPHVALMLLGIEAWKPVDFLTRMQLAKVDLFLTISDHTWRRFVESNPHCKEKAHRTVLLGIADRSTKKIPAPSSTPVALMLSRLSKAEDYKGHREVIGAWPRVLQSSPEAELWIVGDGDLRNDLEQLVTKLSLQDNVRFWGLVCDDTKQELLEQCRCLVMPSRAEGFGLVYLEAMRLGRPCLVSTVDAGREVVNPPEAGLAANPDDEVELADSICRLLSDGPEWRHWSERARRRYEENFTAKHFQERLLAALFENNVPAEQIQDCVHS